MRIGSSSKAQVMNRLFSTSAAGGVTPNFYKLIVLLASRVARVLDTRRVATAGSSPLSRY